MDPEDRFPPFLRLLDSDRDKAWKEFYVFVMKAMSARLPRQIHLFARDKHEDLLQDLILHFVDNDFARLRKYRDEGKPFVGWFYFVANNFLIARRRQEGPETVPIPPEIPEERLSGVTIPEDLARAIGRCFGTLDTYCKALLIMAVQDELKPRQIAVSLALPRSDNKAISEKVRSCLASLGRRLRNEGYDADAVRRCTDA